MSTDKARSNEHDTTETKTRFEVFDETELQRLRSEAVQLVVSGTLTLSDIALDSRIDGPAELADGENDAFRDSIRDQLENIPEHDATPEEEAEQGEGWSPDDVEFAAIWDEFGLPDTASNTQLVQALAVSDHTSFGTGGARRAIELAVDDNHLIDCEVEIDDDRYECDWLSGVKYKRGVDQ